MLPAIAAGALAGCGSDDTAEVGTEALVPGKPDYIAEADAVCSRFEDRINADADRRFGLSAKDVRVTAGGRIVFRDPAKAPSEAEIEAFASQTVVPALRDQVSELRDLTPPAGDAERVAAIYDAAQRGIAELAADPAALDDPASTRRLFVKARRLGRGYGLRVCGV